MVSVIIPVYNVEKYLSQCVESVLKLKSELEIILVDDGSTDKSGELCDSLALTDCRIKVVHKENGGLSSARNEGIKKASGEYLMFLDSDDFLDHTSTENLLSELQKGAEITIGLYNCYYEQDDRYEKESCDALLQMDGVFGVDDFLKQIPADGRSCYMVAVRFIVKRDFILENNLFFMEGIYHEDEEWTQRVLCSAKEICVTHNFFYQYRQARLGSITGNTSIKHIMDRFAIIARFEDSLIAQPCNSAKNQYTKMRQAQLYLGNMIDYHKLDTTSQKEVLSKLRDKKHLSKYLHGTIGTLVKLSQGLIGVWATCRLLGLVDTFMGG